MRKLLYNLAIRLRMARKNLGLMERYRYDSPEDYMLAYGVWLEAHNSFQAAKQIYFDSKENNND